MVALTPALSSNLGTQLSPLLKRNETALRLAEVPNDAGDVWQCHEQVDVLEIVKNLRIPDRNKRPFDEMIRWRIINLEGELPSSLATRRASLYFSPHSAPVRYQQQEWLCQ